MLVDRRTAVVAGLLSSVIVPKRAWSVTPLPTLPPLPFDIPPESRLSRLLESSTRLKPQLLPRSKLEQDFAVLLMRTGYSLADELDFFPMDEFQKDFFMFRQREWEIYREELPGVQQGMLTDPAYFDFISFAQYATISASARAAAADLRNGIQLFDEQVDANGTKVVKQRDASFADSEVMLARHSQRMGEVVLDWILGRYPANFAPQLPTGPTTAAAVREGVQRILTIFEINGYMLLNKLEPLDDGVRVTLVAPASLWSQRVLQQRRETNNARNDYEVKTIQAYLLKCGVLTTTATSFTGNSVVHTFTWPKGLLA